MMNGFASLTMIVIETEIRLFLRGEMLHQKHESYKYVLPLKKRFDWISMRGETKVTTSKKVYFEKKGSKIKTILFLQFMTTLHNFPLTVETS